MASLSRQLRASPRNSRHDDALATLGHSGQDMARASQCMAIGKGRSTGSGRPSVHHLVHDPSAQPPPTLTCCSLFFNSPALSVHPKRGREEPSPTQPILPSRKAPGAAAHQQHRHGTALVSSGFNVPRRGGVFLFHFEQSNTRGRGGTERRPIENASPTAAASASLPVRYGYVRRASWYQRLRATCHISYPSRAPLALVDLFG